MKKIVLFSLVAILGVVNTSFAAGSCQIRDLKASEKQDSDEYLYVSAGHHRNKQAFACERRGDPKNCNNGVKVAVKGEHYIGGVAVGSSFEVLECQQRGLLSNDKWVNVGTSSLKKCDKSSLEYSYVLIGEMDANNKVYCMKNKYVSQGTSGWCVGIGDYDICVSDGCVDCNKPDPKTEPKPDPKPKTCEELYAGNADLIKCCKAKDAEVKNGVCKCNDSKKEWKDGKCVNKDDVKPVGACDSFKGNPEAYACCTAGYLWQNGKCEGCPDGQKWYWDGTKGICIDVEVVNPADCTPSDCEITIKQSVQCNNGHYLSSTETYGLCKEDLNARNLNCEQFKAKVNSCKDVDCIRQWLTRLDAYDELIARVCKDSGNAPVVNPNNAEIEEAKRTLTAFFADAEKNRNVWRDEEGKFNTVRLASDLTAGVVLGTVGGVVSGVVIKKKQVEKGFDALHCTVGGQNIADWGDTFNVGLRR